MRYEIKIEECDLYEDVFSDIPDLTKKDVKMNIVFRTPSSKPLSEYLEDAEIIHEQLVEYGGINTDVKFAFDVVVGTSYEVTVILNW